MRKIILFTAASLDGLITGKDESLDWLFEDNDYGYNEFIETVDTLLMGYKSYKIVLSFGIDFPYKDKINYVFSRNHEHNDDNPVKFIKDPVPEFLANLRKEQGKDIWLVGGGQINTILLNNDLIDEMVISVHPAILGDGIKLFKGEANRKSFKLKSAKTFKSGLVQLVYTKSL
jgi:dihydrofolate reductase